MAFTLVRTATGPDQDSTTVSFSENDGGDFLIALFATVGSSNDGGAAPSSLTDTNGNVWDLLAWQNGIPIADGNDAAFAVYITGRVPASPTTNDLSFPAQLLDSVVLATWSNGIEISAPYFSLAQDTNVFFNETASGDTVAVALSTLNEAIVSGIWDASLNTSTAGVLSSSPTPSMKNLGFGGAGASIADSNLYGFGDFSGQDSTNIESSLDDATSTFGISVALVGSNTNPNAGGAAQTLTFGINKGPDPVVLKEGRAIATVQIDCTQQPVQGSVNYPEFALFDPDLMSGLGIEGFTVCEFDLEHLFQGSGLSEVRSLMYWARPAFGIDSATNPVSREDGGYETAYPAMITNTTTLQTISMGGSVANRTPFDGANSGYVTGANGVISFPANKHSLKYRFICPQANASNPLGKFNLQFTNFEVPPTPEQGAVFSESDD
jgi:hypothetical protein